MNGTSSKGSVALLTPVGRGAVASLLICGDISLLDCPNNISTTLFHAVNGKSITQQPINRIVFGHWGSADRQEEVISCRTAHDRCEIHCHGGLSAIERIQQDLLALGFKGIAWHQLGELSDWEREYQYAISHAITTRTAFHLLEQQSCFRQSIQKLIVKLDRAAGSNAVDEVATALQQILQWKEFGYHLYQPWQVVLFGKPNVGKSSLVNAILGFQRAIVHDQPGTTRDLVTALTALEGWPVNLVDTAGLRKLAADESSCETRSADHQIESDGIKLAESQLTNADLKLLIYDQSLGMTESDADLYRQHPDAIVVANKSDLALESPQQSLTDTVSVSARTGAGIPELCSRIINSLIPQVPVSNTVIPFTSRHCNLLEQAIAELTTAHLETSSIAVSTRNLLNELIS